MPCKYCGSLTHQSSDHRTCATCGSHEHATERHEIAVSPRASVAAANPRPEPWKLKNRYA